MLVVALVAASGCKPVDRTGDVQIAAATLDKVAPRSVVLVTIDGVRWEDVFLGVDPRLAHGSALAALEQPFALMPETKALVDGGGVALGGGGVGCGIVAPTNPGVLSLPGYDEMLGGRTTACETNDCPRVVAPTVLDAAAQRGKGPVGSIDSWGKLARAASNGGSDVFLSAGRSDWPTRPENAVIETELALAAADPPFPGHGNYRNDFHTERLALAYLASRHPRLLHVGLGDTDEYGHRGDYPAYVRAIRGADRFIAEVATLAAAERIPTTVIVTTDHGRDVFFRDHGKAFPLSKRSFVLAFGDGVEHGGNVCQHRDIGLPDVGATVRALLSLPPDGSPGAGKPIEEISGTVASR